MHLLLTSPPDLQHYAGETFTCRQSGGWFSAAKAIPISWVNDDYCDCEDGSDEPGKSPDLQLYLALTAAQALPRATTVISTAPIKARAANLCRARGSTTEFAVRVPIFSHEHADTHLQIAVMAATSGSARVRTI